ncbi:hypothetical protein BKA66DRAFT_461635 [Pyrenochaeta sp. MPI-SDFR-AT-0127]|nr:hypothetical protein BKA66DRAFT_461635 [Pyrenochaeta sp. MPI-SDFR-AT-0127]
MAPKIQFINSTGDTTPASRKAHKKLAKSHITARRHFEQRQRDVEEHEQQQAQNNISVWFSKCSSPSTTNARSQQSDTPQSASSVPAQEHPPEPTREAIRDKSTGDNDLRLESQGGHLIQIPFQFPFLRMVTSVADPFKLLPGNLTPRMRPHIYYYINILMPALHPAYTTNLVRKTFGCSGLFAQADELTVNYTSAFAATSRAAANGNLSLSKLHGLTDAEENPGFHEGVYDWLFFKGRTIKLLNEKLDKGMQAEDEILTDSVVHAICNLVLMELFTGNVYEAQCHMIGVRHIAAIWHQRKEKPMSYKTAATVIACIVKLATLTLSTPATPFYLSFHAPLPFPLPSISHILPSLGNMLIIKWPVLLTSPLTLETDFRPILHDLAQMTRYTEAVFSWNFPYVDDDSYMEYVNFHNLEIEHRMLSVRFEGEIEQAVRLSCILYLNTVLVRGYPVDSAIIQNVLRALVKLLGILLDTCGKRHEYLVSLWAGFEDVLLWVLFIGVYCSHARKDRDTFRAAFLLTANQLGLATIMQAKDLLSGFFFVNRVHAQKLEETFHSEMEQS